MDNPFSIGEDNSCDCDRTSSIFFNSFALEIGISELKSHYRIPDGKIIERAVKFASVHCLVTA
jgi:hypothetical protein